MVARLEGTVATGTPPSAAWAGHRVHAEDAGRGLTVREQGGRRHTAGSYRWRGPLASVRVVTAETYDPGEVLNRAGLEFERRLRAVAPGQWDAPTPCEGWSVRDLVDHVVGGNRLAQVLMRGASAEEAVALVRDTRTRGDALGDFAASRDEQVAAFREPGALDRTVHHPIGDIPSAQLLQFRVADLTLHAWDLARAIGADERLDEPLVRWLWDRLSPLAPFIGRLGAFGSGPSGQVDEHAPVQQRLLDLTGRRP